MCTGDNFALSDAGVGGFENENTEACATFYGAGCALYQDLFTDLASLGGPPLPPPPPITPLGAFNEITPVRIFFAMGMSPSMQNTGTLTKARSTDLALTPYRRNRRNRRNLQSSEDSDFVEIIDSSDDPEVIRTCTSHTDHDTLCETAGFENAVRFFAPISNQTS